MIDYGQACPVAKAAGILGERWTILIVRELLVGASGFSEIKRAFPRASPSIISKRLSDLEAAGIVEKHRKHGQGHSKYRLTQAGEELGPLVESMGIWATRWAAEQLRKEELDEYLMMVEISRRICVEKLPSIELNIGFSFSTGEENTEWWLVVKDQKIDLCREEPGPDIDLWIQSSPETFTEIWLGRKSLPIEIESGMISIFGDQELTRTATQWLGFSLFAEVVRP